MRNNSNINSILYYGKIGEGTTCYISKHVLISYELLEQCSQILYKDTYKNVLHKWAISLIDAIFTECKERFNEKYKTVLERIFIRNRVVYDQNESDFSKLILDISIPELRKEILLDLVNNATNLAESTNPEEEPSIYMMTAHFYGHLSRIYSKDAIGLINFEKAVEYSQKSMYYLEKCNGQDSIIYHIHGEALRLLFKENCKEILNSEMEITNEKFTDLEDEISEIRRYYDIAAQIGGNIYATTSTIRLLIDYLKFVYKYKNIGSLEEIKILSANQQIIRLDIEELIHLLDMEELDEKNKIIYNNLIDEYHSGIMLGDYSHAIQYFQNRMDYLISHQGSISEIATVRQSLVNARLAKYRKGSQYRTSYYSEIPFKEIEEILELLEKSFDQNIDINDFSERRSRCAAYKKWMDLAKYSTRDITKGIFYAKQWKELVEKEHRYDPNPYYYLYVLYYLSVLEGNRDDERYIEEYRKLSYYYANNKGYCVSYIRDVLVSGNGMGQICDADVIESWGDFTIKRPVEFIPLEGRFEAVESKKGIVSLKSPIKWANRKAKFQTRENNSLADEQKTHLVSFYGGFSYEMITAINSTVRDITSGEILPDATIFQENIVIAENGVMTAEKTASSIGRIETTEVESFIPGERYDVRDSSNFYINGYIEGNKPAGIPSSDIAKYGKQIIEYGSMDDLVEKLLEIKSIPVIRKLYSGKRYKVSMYETGNSLNDILSKNNTDIRDDKKICYEKNVLKSEPDFPDYCGNIQFIITEIKNDKIIGNITIEGCTYAAKITSGISRKKIQDLKKMNKINKSIQAKVVDHNDSFYILRF